MIRHQDWGEADRIITVFSLEKGKVRAVAKGVRRLRSRKAGHLEPFTRLNMLLAKGRDLPIITQAESIQAYLPLRESLELVGYASYLAELLDRFSVEEEQNVPLFHLLVDTLDRLAKGAEPGFEQRYYEIRLLDYIGFRPQLFECIRCGETITAQDQYFSFEMGGVVCPRCGREGGGVYAVSMQALKYLRHLQRSSYTEARRANISPTVQSEMEQLMQRYIQYLLERRLNTPQFIRSVTQLQHGNG